MSLSPFGKIVADLLNAACEPTVDSGAKERSFSDAEFFRLFYRESGTPYFFLFKKNLKVTNIQFAELLALLRTHTSSNGNTKPRDLRFVTTSDFRNWIRSVVFTFNTDLKPERFQEIARLYEPLLRRTIICDPFFTSCAVFFPPLLDTDLLRVCAYSGYIHSCGRSIFIRKTEKTEKAHLYQALNWYLRDHSEGKRIFFEVYAHEDFTKHDRTVQSELSHGLDDVKIYVEKFHMGAHRLVSVIEDMRIHYEGKLIVPDPGDYRRQIKEKHRTDDIDQTRTLWLIKDQSIYSTSDGRHFSGQESFYICYEQLLKNDNPLHIFDENKPGWYSHTTIPHTLMGAMLNITRPLWINNTKIADPFAGTGTTFLESLKYDNVLVNCGDIGELAEIVSHDNLSFFAKDVSELKVVEADLRHLQSLLNKPADNSQLALEVVLPVEQAYFDAREDIGNSRRKVENLARHVAKKLEHSTFTHRLIYYVCLRARIRGGAALERQSISWDSAVEKECNELLAQVIRLRELREQERIKYEWPHASFPEDISVFVGDYSINCSIPPATFAKALDKPFVTQRDCRKLPAKSCDVVVSDPPYGFNTDDEAFQLGELWSSALFTILKSFRDRRGQLVLCLPDHTHIGRQLHFFTNKQFVTHQVLGYSDEMNMLTLKCSDVVPRPVAIFRPPYYWESERALRRSILHFIFQPNSHADF